jgi:tRNA(Arg) A34 adenosine deaminase TadA
MNPATDARPDPNPSRRGWLAGVAGLAVPGVALLAAPPAGRADDPKPVPAADKARAERFLRRAIELARRGVAARDGGPFGAVVVKGDEVVGEGWNHVVSGFDPTAHGEIYAIRAAGRRLKSFDLSGCDLFTSGEPCPMCLAATYWARIGRVYYGFSIAQAATVGFDDQYFYDELAKPMAARKVTESQVLGAEAFALLKAFAADPKRVKY